MFALFEDACSSPPLPQVTCRWHSTRGYEHSPPSATVSEKGRGTSVLHKYSFYCINIQNGSVFWYAAFYSLKAWVLRCKTKGFRVRNQGFQDVKPRVLQTRGINFEKCKQRHCICLQIITIFTFIKLKTALPPFCIFMQFWGCEDVETISDKLQYWTITRQWRTIIRQRWTITRQYWTTT